MDLNRRRFMCVCGGALALGGCGGGEDDTPSQQTAEVHGCTLSAAAGTTALPGCGQPQASSGNAGLDQAFRQEFDYQRSFWNLPSVSFAFLSDCDSPNAYANPNNMAVLFGTTLAAQTYSKYGTPLPLWQVLAHEFGHMMQFVYGASWLNSGTAAPRELEADMFSGFYLIYAKAFVSPAEMQTSLQQAFSIGDYAYNNQNHHGTPLQRMAAVVAGGKVANEYFAGAIPQTVDAMRQRFYQELRQIISW
ncbi:ImmA/IrrE family metallo-endopeptidase [Ideonella sp. BN130291]|uniref:ImmA/IrrE family metallo-endopeptidase n=1 Tax=Ideonella sp. BN130291 TaxID=3112940 RepID=UPI002E257BF6|nr:hypothetical protein [Ideonella sp. BN130291]